ncbi:MAG TPA: regulatory iron-sulfur-containing complex subunit RicT [Spirochaetota bacterium]|nr:regulatory iron-sulfur-containing complex subunit RicT [Spirochaetota bacterium]HPC40195.1 regulatory iron-sulfur-containing complex subunit RicT [Spirochaetota bacterium]HPL16175.1 regulatory iron-sulfur-containing complex subunit RicT [Spirochaetota bacterium]HQF07331.1 regulatory iron-sulfur-containing complex subunit RicT [Spirochaetota bacterium]HQH96232.1 regulatory iron-sulfur-containing complex subunit RicT [Spirochaetota bacterium]
MEISAVKLRNSYQINYVDTNHLFVNQNALCVVETEHGIDIGNVFKCRKTQNEAGIEVKGKLLRLTTPDDLKQIPEIVAIEKNAFDKCREKAKAKKLDMKLISVKCLFDRTKIIFYFVAENRIDFRELVRELASIFRTRIEMRQIGVRDEARLVGGYGPCGKQLCCVHQSEEFEPVSIKMAKEQNLNLNSLKISGMCGRLLCCLGYEYKLYKEINQDMPDPGAQIIAGDTTYVVTNVDTLKETIRMRHKDRTVEIFKSDLEINGKTYVLKKEIVTKIETAEEDTHEEDTYTL